MKRERIKVSDQIAEDLININPEVDDYLRRRELEDALLTERMALEKLGIV